MKKKNLNNLTFGNFIDLESNLNADILSKSIYLFDFDIGENAEDVKLNILLNAVNDYNDYRINIFENYKTLFGGEDDGEEKNKKMLEKYGIKTVTQLSYNFDDEEEIKENKQNDGMDWYRIAYRLAGENFLKINEVFQRPLIQVLNHLIFLMNNK